MCRRWLTRRRRHLHSCPTSCTQYSADATHVMLTAPKCCSHELTFASVHDSCWALAGNIDQMLAMLRDTFIIFYSSDVLEKLREKISSHF